ncbi:ubiquitin thioesterase otulin-like isoform X2 [Heptranchias perlo]|uniref:ubiquitin thioesterase otulin-like isoform X2 n=1 Tax=Heptranchias perlo TaxID=212740 RepID=UPI00355A2BFE
MWETLEMEYVVQILDWIYTGIQAVACAIDYILYYFIVLSVTGLVLYYTYAELLTKDRLTSKEDTISNRGFSACEQMSEVKEHFGSGTKTENHRKILESENSKDVSSSSVDLLQHSNGEDRLDALIEVNRIEDLSLRSAELYIGNPTEILDIYTSTDEGCYADVTCGGTSNTKQWDSDEEDLYRSVDDIKESRLSKSVLGSGLKGDLILCNESTEGTTRMEAESSVLNSINLKNDNYQQLRLVMCEALIKGKRLPSWIMTEEALKIPKKLSQEGYDWINQWCLEHKICGNSIEKLEICLETFQKKWTAICCLESETGRANECGDLVEDEETEQRMYEAMKFLMLYKAIHLHNALENGRNVPEFCKHLFTRSTSLYPYYLMVNHLNLIGHTRNLEETEMELLKYTLEVTIADSFDVE